MMKRLQFVRFLGLTSGIRKKTIEQIDLNEQTQSKLLIVVINSTLVANSTQVSYQGLEKVLP